MPAKDYLRYDDQEHEDITEEYSFDELARDMADGTLTRGRALKLIGAALLAGALSIFGLTGPAEAQKKKKRRRKRLGAGTPSPCGPNPSCPQGTRCQNGICLPT